MFVFLFLALPMMDEVQCSTDEPSYGIPLHIYCRIHSFSPQTIEVHWCKERDPIPDKPFVSDPTEGHNGLFSCITSIVYLPKAGDVGKKFICKANLKGSQECEESVWEMKTLGMLSTCSIVLFLIWQIMCCMLSCDGNHKAVLGVVLCMGKLYSAIWSFLYRFWRGMPGQQFRIASWFFIVLWCIVQQQLYTPTFFLCPTLFRFLFCLLSPYKFTVTFLPSSCSNVGSCSSFLNKRKIWALRTSNVALC